MNKWIAIGDIHGRDTWKSIVNTEIDNVDKIIFVGDYFDSFDIPITTQISNFLDILEFKRANSDKVVLLTGNHDIHYLKTLDETYSGYSHAFALMIENDCIIPAIRERLLQICYMDSNFIFTHAGVTKTWLLLTDVIESIYEEIGDLDVKLNDLFFYKPRTFRYQSNYKFSLSDPYGDNIWQGPLWVRPNSLLKDKIAAYTQVVGHTQVDEIVYRDDVYFIDSLHTGAYLYFDPEHNSNPIIKNISK